MLGSVLSSLIGRGFSWLERDGHTCAGGMGCNKLDAVVSCSAAAWVYLAARNEDTREGPLAMLI